MALVIRKEQMDALAAGALESKRRKAPFEHLQECFPTETEQLGPERVRELVEDARTHCARYGINDISGLLHYLNLVMTLGEGFDSDGPFAWTAEILGGPASSEQKFQEISKRLELPEDES